MHSYNGILLIDKPAGITSFDIIRRLRRQLGGTPKIGHAGTLDPMATGLMIMLFGSYTKRAIEFSKLDKTYIGEMTLGSVSSTGDREGELSIVSKIIPSEQEIYSVFKKFEGEIVQIPSKYSAIKVGGIEAYKLARKGREVEIPSRKVTVHQLRVISYEYPKVNFEAEVSSGTYIRTLAEDIGSSLETGAYLSDLRRIKIGRFLIENSIDLAVISRDNIETNLKSAPSESA
jgi:tRNA pseudouridine55 synthase